MDQALLIAAWSAAQDQRPVAASEWWTRTCTDLLSAPTENRALVTPLLKGVTLEMKHLLLNRVRDLHVEHTPEMLRCLERFCANCLAEIDQERWRTLHRTAPQPYSRWQFMEEVLLHRQ